MNRAIALQSGLRGIDCNARLTPRDARVVRQHGYSFVLRYLPRLAPMSHDISAEEVAVLHAEGLAVGFVQHVERDREPGWVPSESKGRDYGAGAAEHARKCGVPPGVNLWLDLEGVSESVSSAVAVAYAQAWHHRVASEGFEPGIYVGWSARINARDLYYRLAFKHYWVAYNLNADQYPLVRGPQMFQRAAKTSDKPVGLGFGIDVDVIKADAKGGLPVFYVPEGWAMLAAEGQP